MAAAGSGIREAPFPLSFDTKSLVLGLGRTHQAGTGAESSQLPPNRRNPRFRSEERFTNATDLDGSCRSSTDAAQWLEIPSVWSGIASLRPLFLCAERFGGPVKRFSGLVLRRLAGSASVPECRGSDSAAAASVPREVRSQPSAFGRSTASSGGAENDPSPEAQDQPS